MYMREDGKSSYFCDMPASKKEEHQTSEEGWKRETRNEKV
jgi:hypothetical protein